MWPVAWGVTPNTLRQWVERYGTKHHPYPVSQAQAQEIRRLQQGLKRVAGDETS